MAEFWTKRINNGKYPVLNIDEDSTTDQKKIGQQVCKQYGFHYIDREERGMHNNVISASKFFGDKVKFIIWFQTDCWPLQDDFFPRFEQLVDSGKLNEFGVIGFNGIAQDVLRKRFPVLLEQFHKGENPLAVVARSPLEIGSNWQAGVTNKKIEFALDKDLFQKPFAVEITAYFATAVNVEKFKQLIDITHPFHFFHSWDDICCQFLNKNVYNVIFPDLYLEHRPDLKPKFKIPSRSVKLAYKNKDKYHSLVGFTEKEWKSVWGFEFDNRSIYKEVQNRYKGTLIDAFYNHDPRKGPLKTFG